VTSILIVIIVIPNSGAIQRQQKSMKNIEINLRTDRDLTDKEAYTLEKAIARYLNKFGIEEWHRDRKYG